MQTPGLIISRGALASVLSATVIGLTAQSAFAFSLLSGTPKWTSDEYSNPCGQGSAFLWWPRHPCVIGMFGTSELYSHPGWADTMKSAASGWTESSSDGLDFKYDTATPVNDQVQVDSADLGGYNSHGVIVLGQSAWFAFFGNMVAVTDTMNTNGAISWCTVDMSGCPTSSQFNLREAMDHEMGHALGLDHPTQGPNSWAVMQCTQATGETTYVQTDDYNGEKHIYEDGAPGTPSPKAC